MGFEDTFTRDEGGKSNLQYDDTAFYYFFISVLASVIFPLLFCIIKPFLRNPVKGKLKDICPCQSCKAKADKLSQLKRYNFITNGYIFKIVVVVLLLLLTKQIYEQIDHAKQSMKKFDPYDILEIPQGSERDVIKKAFRRMSRIYHPDKNRDDPEATAKFIMVAKAHECLTDEKKKHLCEKYGNPDGPGKLNVAIAMPSFLLKKENSVTILFCFFFILLVVLPGSGYYWYQNASKKNEHGVLNTTTRQFYHKLNESLIIKNCPEILTLCDEFKDFPKPKGEQREDLVRLLKNLEPDFNLKKLPEALRNDFATPYVLICSHLQGQIIPKSLQEMYNQVVLISPTLIQGMISFIMSVPFFHRKFPPEQRGNIKFFGLEPMIKLIEFQQMMVQGLWLTSSDVFQLSYFTENPVEQRNKRLPKLQELISAPSEQRKLNFVMDEKDKPKVNAEIDQLPNVEFEVFAGVEGEEEITDIDQLSIDVKIVRKHLLKKCPKLKQKAQKKQTKEEDDEDDDEQDILKQQQQELESKTVPNLIHAVKYPTFRNEKWHVIVATEKKEIISYQLVSGNGITLKSSFQTRCPVGLYKFWVYIKSDSYKGYDLEKEVQFVVKDNRTVTRKIDWHEEDIALENEPTFLNKMMQQLNPQQQNSDDEEEEEEEEDKKNKKNLKNLSKKQKKEDDDEEEEEEEEEEK